ncbi:S1-like domain-containing RNA-binding protein, partial [Streptococcus suis]
MNDLLAQYIVGLVTDENDKFYFVQKEGRNFDISKYEGENSLGQSVKVFAYTDMKQKL